MFKVFYLPQFSIEFSRFPKNQQDKILDFTDIFEESGLSDFSLYEGKISPSWSTLSENHPDYAYTKTNHLWHYHVGIPTYLQRHPTYKTSDMLLHFQWPQKSETIYLVDMYDHYKSDGTFYLPPPSYLKK